jgi:hypothetical protein
MMLDRAGGTFQCHKTNVKVGGKGDPMHCAGALIFAEKNGNETQLMRIAGRLNMYDPNALDMDADVFDTMDEMLDAAIY